GAQAPDGVLPGDEPGGRGRCVRAARRFRLRHAGRKRPPARHAAGIRRDLRRRAGMSERVRLEIAANSLASALAAQAGGADRIELCENLGEGGCTPSFGTIAAVRDRLEIPLYVLIRPRGGDFRYDEGECEVMLRDIEACVRLGC